MKKLFYLIAIITYQIFYSQAAEKTISCYDLKEILKVEPTLLYKPHLDAAKSFNVKILKNSSTVTKYINKGKFHKVKKSGAGFRVQKLDYSRPWLVSKASLSLERIGLRFSKNTGGAHFIVTSVTRTLEDQCRLRKVNSNASLGVSSHNYGNSFDISYVRFNGVLKSNPKLEAALEKVLEYYYKEGKILYIKEKQQSCFHVTVKNH
ncbi:hypothetical protein SAMN05421796_104158 [Chryseobacterium piscicola]|uniref:Uncharacterized protein n=1 Tax=Chryseobacterium piscicola TaxID=551459 RepID=A0A1N7MC09_9FLAO|nr:DUF5715 family protein [Chryseobacterium piscicola]PQA98109.1 hypothetical protein B0A70_00555 [Chryseobacterium piscicola]SIS83665.1 hypothetical protein SAMN05421796_104158 [Chryseobacterium piscicola]